MNNTNRIAPAIVWAITGAVVTQIAMTLDNWAVPIVSGFGWGLGYIMALKSLEPQEPEKDERDFSTISYENTVMISVDAHYYSLPVALLEKTRRAGFHVVVMNGKLNFRYLYELGWTENGVRALHAALLKVGLIEPKNASRPQVGYKITEDGMAFMKKMAIAYAQEDSPTREEWKALAMYLRHNAHMTDTFRRPQIWGRGV